MTKNLFAANKKIYDSLHGFIRYTPLEKEVIDSLPFQRLHFVRQLGTAYLAYPGATHTRFEHSLGTMHLASSIYDKLCTNSPEKFPEKDSAEFIYWQTILRLSALCHDLGHPPFSHVAEKELLGKDGHEQWTIQIIASPYLAQSLDLLQKSPLCLKGHIVQNDIIKVALGEEKLRNLKSPYASSFSPWETMLSQIIIGDFFGADRIDYLLRDAKYTGIAHGFFDYVQLLESLCLLPSLQDTSIDELGIEESGLESCEALFLARNFMHKRVYQYPSVKAYGFHLRNFIKTFFAKTPLQDLAQFLRINDSNVICALNDAAFDPAHPHYLDAQRIITRKGSFKAIPISPKVSQKTLQEFKDQHNIEMQWELHGYSEVPKVSHSFLVLKKSGEIKTNKECSSLFSAITPPATNWVYTPAKFEQELLKLLATL